MAIPKIPIFKIKNPDVRIKTSKNSTNKKEKRSML
jgi:hypothetical protein